MRLSGQMVLALFGILASLPYLVIGVIFAVVVYFSTSSNPRVLRWVVAIHSLVGFVLTANAAYWLTWAEGSDRNGGILALGADLFALLLVLRVAVARLRAMRARGNPPASAPTS